MISTNNSFGGGGHAAEAGLRRKTHEPEQLLELILEEIRNRVKNVIVWDEYSC